MNSPSTERINTSVQLPTSADNVTLLAVTAERRPCSNRSISPARRAHSSKPAAAACGRHGCRKTDRRTPDSFIDPAPHTMQAVSITRAELQRRTKAVTANSHRQVRHDKTIESVSRPLRRCELDFRQLKTVAD